MARVIGRAGDFYRVRVVTIDDIDGLDLEWRDDILYRRPPDSEIIEGVVHMVEAVMLDDDDVAVRLAGFRDAEQASMFRRDVESALDDMTRSEFEGSYFPETAR